MELLKSDILIHLKIVNSQSVTFPTLTGQCETDIIQLKFSCGIP